MYKYYIINSEVVESECEVLSPSSVSQMLSSPSSSVIEEVFAPNEVFINSPLDDLIREVSVSPTEELLKPTLTVNSEKSKVTNNKFTKRTKKDINQSSKKKKQVVTNNVYKLKPVSSSIPYTIKVEPSGDDPPVISIPDMDFLEPEV